MLTNCKKNIKIPTLIVWGRNDPVIPASIGAKPNSDIPNSKLKILNNCGHVPHKELPKETYNIMLDIIR